MKYSHGPNIRIKGDQTNLTATWCGTAQVALRYGPGRADSRFVPSQWETVLLCNDVSHWLGASLESTLPGWGLLSQFPPFHYFSNFATFLKHTLAIEYHIYIFDRCHSSWAAGTHVIYDCDSSNLSYFGKIEKSLSHPHSRLWWWHNIEMFSALMALYGPNPPVAVWFDRERERAGNAKIDVTFIAVSMNINDIKQNKHKACC